MNTTAPDQPVPQAARPLGSYRYYDLLLSVFIVALLISNLVAQKVCKIGPFNVGGGNPSGGLMSGIHWHMNIANEVTYIAADDKRQKIPWVRMRNRLPGPAMETRSRWPGNPSRPSRQVSTVKRRPRSLC